MDRRQFKTEQYNLYMHGTNLIPLLDIGSRGSFVLDLGNGLMIPLPQAERGARWLSGRVSDSGARSRGFETYRRRVVFLSKTLYFPKVLVNYPGSGGSVPT